MEKRYMVMINMGGGLHSIKTLYKKKDWGAKWWDRGGNFDSEGLGWIYKDGFISFTTKSLRDAKLAHKAIEAYKKILKRII